MNSDDQLRPVWYCLMDSNGSPFKGTSVACVNLIPSTAVVDEFRAAVVFANTPRLNHTVPAQLKIFTNKASLVKSFANNKAEPVHPNVLLKGLGMNASKKALMVVIPKVVLEHEANRPKWGPWPVPTLKWIITDFFDRAQAMLLKAAFSKLVDGKFQPCTHRFYSQFPHLVDNKGWLEFPTKIPRASAHKLYIRSAYKCIADAALSNKRPNDCKYVIVSGTPGVGKSVFIYYVLWRLVKDNQRVLLLVEKPMIYFDGQAIHICEHLPLAENEEFWTPNLWCLVDSMDPTTIPGFPVHECSVLLASTPRSDYISEFYKLAPPPVRFYMPLWTKDELTEIAPYYPNATNVWIDRFDHLGGIP